MFREAVWLGVCVCTQVQYSELQAVVCCCVYYVTRSADRREGTQTEAEAERDKRWGKGKVSWLVVES